ncbi:uncharacterized protein LOC124445553 [Xenia sp. Carnegie-2017]|uniref:uncharacterized protein LOC124445553 n=1 Tax=Xenia sp. Carnegie-2017 TaxID=2897299 RepID=UPI001F045258|nr:uncharacterized protein LOC124445553 [Xenia sp. Carnegie-2017]XP_046852230.1 uncharacterized protein LOC124445553 [Xenia sp. Carnegie-2017]
MKVGFKALLIVVSCLGILYLYILLKLKTLAFINSASLYLNSNRFTYAKNNILHRYPSVSLFMRLSGKRQEHKKRFYCNMLKTIPLFWPGWLGKMVLILDKESKKDHAFGETLLNQTKEHFPHQAFKIDYERLPKDPKVLTFPGQKKSSGYNRQLWSSFFIDLYTDDEVIAWLDSDSPFVLPVTMSTITPHGKVRVLGTECTMPIGWVQSWAKSTEMAIGFPQVADFMTYFPVYIYRDTFTHCREHILKKFKTDNFEEAFKKFHHTGTGYISPVSVIFSYAWFFEKDRYDWNIKMCNNLDEYNKRLPEGHKILQNDIINENKLLTQPQTAYHGPLNAQDYYAKLIPISYCLSISEAGRSEDMCKKYSRSDLNRLFNLFKSDMHSIKERLNIPHPCIGNHTQYCLSILERHIKKVSVEIKENKRRMTWDDVTTVDSIARKTGVNCTPQPL